jgi:dCMP deaminase
MRDEQGIASGTRHECCMAVHAEMNLVCQAAYEGVCLLGSTVYTTHYPCSICAKILVNSGISEVVFGEYYPDSLTESILINIRVRKYGD